MTKYSIINYMRAGNNFAGMCVFAAPIINAVKIAKRDPEMLGDRLNDQQLWESFGRQLDTIGNMRTMWNALNPNDRWDYIEFNIFVKQMWDIFAKYRRMERA